MLDKQKPQSSGVTGTGLPGISVLASVTPADRNNSLKVHSCIARPAGICYLRSTSSYES